MDVYSENQNCAANVRDLPPKKASQKAKAPENRTSNKCKSVYIAWACKNYYRKPAMTLLNASVTSDTTITSELLTTDQVATALGLSSRTLASWRSSRTNSLPYLKTGSRVRYRPQDVATWLESRVCSATTNLARGHA